MKNRITANFMRKLSLVVILAWVAILLDAQSVAINTTGTIPHASAMLDISGTDKGVLVPRMTSAQRTAIANPAEGLLVFDNQTKTFWFFSGSWKELKPPSGGQGNFSLPLDITQEEASTPLMKLTNSSIIGTNGAFEGVSNSTENYATAVRGVISSTAPGSFSAAIRGINSSTNVNGIGIWGSHAGSGWGMYGSSGGGYGVYGYSASNYGVVARSSTGTAFYAFSTTGPTAKFENTSSSNANNIINATTNGNGIVVNAESTGDGIAINGKSNNAFGASIYGMNTASSGRAIWGSATGADGIAIQGDAGNSSSTSMAGYFKNSNAANATTVVQIDNQGIGKSLYVNNTNLNNNSDLIQARSSGTGNFLSLVTGAGDVKTKIDKNGNITTDGSITVKIDKGIVRSSTSTQMVYKVHPVVLTNLNLANNTTNIINVSFNGFSAPPAISVGNYTYMWGGGLHLLHFFVYDVTSTSCQLWIKNNSGITVTGDITINLLMIGAE